MHWSSGPVLRVILPGLALAWSLLAIFSVHSGALAHYPVLRIVLGLVFLLSGVHAVDSAPGRATRLYLLFCAGVCLLLSPAPWFGAGSLSTVIAVVRSALIFAALASILHLAWMVPWGARKPPKPVMQAIYVPAAMAWLMVVVRAVWLSNSGGAFDNFMLIIIGMIAGLLILASAVTFLRKFVRSGPLVRREQGTRTLVLGTIAGLLPGVLAGFTPLGQLPGGRYFYLAAVLVPLTWSTVARNMASGGAEHPDGGR